MSEIESQLLPDSEIAAGIRTEPPEPKLRKFVQHLPTVKRSMASRKMVKSENIAEEENNDEGGNDTLSDVKWKKG
jgi:hypothetical protein